MKKSQFESRLKRVVAWDQEPQLSQDEIDDLIELARITKPYQTHDSLSEWEPYTHYNKGEMVVTKDKEAFFCVEDGVSGDLAPKSLSDVSEYNDGTTKWVYRGLSNYIPTYDLNRAAYEGWGMKAAKASSMISFTSDGATYHRDQYIENCEKMQRKYARNASSKIPNSPRRYPMILEVRVDD